MGPSAGLIRGLGIFVEFPLFSAAVAAAAEATAVAYKVTVAEVVSNQPESIKEALDEVAFGAAYKSVSARGNSTKIPSPRMDPAKLPTDPGRRN